MKYKTRDMEEAILEEAEASMWEEAGEPAGAQRGTPYRSTGGAVQRCCFAVHVMCEDPNFGWCCELCGWNPEVAAMRRELPLQPLPNGLRGKLIISPWAPRRESY